MKNKKYGYQGFRKVLVATLILPFLMIYTTSLSFFNILKSLFKYKWKYLSGNNQYTAYNNLYYYTQSINLNTYGKNGISKLISGGNFKMTNIFNVTPYSLNFQRSFGTTFMMLFATLFWLISWVYLYSDNDNLTILLIVSCFSTIFFIPFIEIQNYNILGWMIYPFFLATLVDPSNYYLLSILTILIAFTSFTAMFIVGILSTVVSLFYLDPYILIAILPGAIIRVIPIVRTLNLQSLSNILGLIGGHNEVKYDRHLHKKIHFPKVYMFILFGQFTLTFALYTEFNVYSILLLTTYLLFIVNSTLIRFADHETFYILYLTVSLFVLLNLETIPIYLYISYILSIYLIYTNILGAMPQESQIQPPIANVYDLSKELNSLNILFSKVPQYKKVLLAFKNPHNTYDNVFNGFRVYNEPILYSTSLNNLTAYPDWYYVMNNNTPSSCEDFWIEDEKEALNYLTKNKIDYIVTSNQYSTFSKENFLPIGSFQFRPIKSLKKEHWDYSITLYKLINKK